MMGLRNYIIHIGYQGPAFERVFVCLKCEILSNMAEPSDSAFGKPALFMSSNQESVDK